MFPSSKPQPKVGLSRAKTQRRKGKKQMIPNKEHEVKSLEIEDVFTAETRRGRAVTKTRSISRNDAKRAKFGDKG